MEALLLKEGISKDANLDLMTGLFDEQYNMVATGSCFKNTLRCIAVDSDYRGEGLLNNLVSNLIQEQYTRGHSHLFLYTKHQSAAYFAELGFYKIAEVFGQVVFMENKKSGFSDYLTRLRKQSEGKNGKKVGAIVMNCNPFTIGHQYLTECAAAQCDTLHLFVVSEDSSIFSFEQRWELILKSTAHLTNIVYHKTEDYMISSATFPSYFLKDKSSAMMVQAKLDIAVFCAIAEHLGITCRFVGDEPFSEVTNIYNQAMKDALEQKNIDLYILERKRINGVIVSASSVRQAIHDGNWELARQMVPQATLDFLLSDRAKTLIDEIKGSDNLLHH